MTRYNAYAPIHKIQRHLLGRTLTALGALDVRDGAAVAAVLGEVRTICAFIEDHSRHEHEYVHPVVARSAPELVAELEAAHAEFERVLDALVVSADILERTSAGEGADDRAYDCYLALSLVAGRYFEHLDLEERRSNAALWAAASDEELQELEVRIMREETWPKMREVAAPSLPLLSRENRRTFCSSMHLAFPQEATVDVLLDIARSSLDDAAVADLRADLASPASR